MQFRKGGILSNKLTKIICNVVFLLLCIGLTFYFVFRGQDFQALAHYIANSSQGFWIAGFGLVVVYILFESIIFYYLLSVFNEKAHLGHCFLYSFVGFFFSLTTPGAMAGQPMQLLFMNRDGLNFSSYVVILLLVTIAFKSVLILIGLVVLVFQPPLVMALLEPIMGWFWLGMVLNAACVGGMLALVFIPSIAGSVAHGFINIAGVFAGKARADVWHESIVTAMHNYSEVSSFVRKHPMVSANVMLLTIVQRCLLFAVTYVVFVSFGMYSVSLPETIMLQGSISLSADMLPLPGGLGISEHLYNVIFNPICGEALTTSTLVISRGLSFYAQLLVSALFTVVAYLRIFTVKKEAEE